MTIATVFWAWYGLGSRHAAMDGTAFCLTHILAPGGVFAITGMLAWRWEAAGGALFVLEGVATVGFIVRTALQSDLTASSILLMCLTLALPLLAAGTLFLISSKRSAWRLRVPHAPGQRGDGQAGEV